MKLWQQSVRKSAKRLTLYVLLRFYYPKQVELCGQRYNYLLRGKNPFANMLGRVFLMSQMTSNFTSISLTIPL